MIVLNSVSKESGRGPFRRLMVDNVTWTISRRERIAIFGHRGTGVSHLLEIIAGTSLPTTGWVTRQGKTSLPGGYLKFAGFGTARTLIDRLCVLYNADPREVAEFVDVGLQSRHALDIPIRLLPPLVRKKLNYALIYAIPCDTYLFDGGIPGGGTPAFRAFCERAFDMRQRHAGMIMTLYSSQAASALDKSMKGAILHRSKFTLYEHIYDAASVFASLPPEEPPSNAEHLTDPVPQHEEEEIFY